MIIQDWTKNAARKVFDEFKAYWYSEKILDTIASVIQSECPFKPEVLYMEVPHCKSCRHWTKNEKLELGTCNLTSYDEESGWIGGIQSKARAVAVDTEEELSIAILETNPDFGCVQWQSKENTNP